MEKVSGIMKTGKTYSDVAVYLPMEDSWMAGIYPEEMQIPGSWSQYELRYVKTAGELKGFHPLWINHYFLKTGILKDKHFICGDADFSSLYVDVEYLDSDALTTILDLAKQGFPVCLKRRPKEPGKIKSGTYQKRLDELSALKNVAAEFEKIRKNTPLLEGKDLPDFWCKKTEGTYYIFFSNPLSRNLHYPISYGQSFTDKEIRKVVKINLDNKTIPLELRFKPYQSLLLKVDKNKSISFVDISYNPPIPEVKETKLP